MAEWLLSPGHYQRLLDGLWITLEVLLWSFVLGVILSLIFGVARLSPHRWIRGVALIYIEFARGISSIILLFIMAYAIPILFGVGQARLITLAAIALGINMGGYGAEIVRGSIQAIPRGQTEASIALNLTPTHRLRHIVLPQAMRIILPPMGNLTIEILKGTALVSLIGMTDLMGATRNLISTQLAAGVAGVTVLFVNVLVIYFVVAQVINLLFRLGEASLRRRYQPRTGRRAVPVPEA